MYCWDAGDGVGAPAGCEGVGAAGSSVTYGFWLPGGCAWGCGFCSSVTYWGWGVAAVAAGLAAEPVVAEMVAGPPVTQ